MAENVFAQFLQPVRSVSDYMSDMDTTAMRRMQMAGLARQNALSEETAQDTMRRKNALRELLANPEAADPKRRVELAMRNPVLMQDAMGWQKDQLEADYKSAQIAAQKAAAEKDAAAKVDAEKKRYRETVAYGMNDLASRRSPSDALAALRQHAANGLPQDVVSEVSKQLMGISTPEQWQAWQQQTNGFLQTAAQRIEAEDRARQAARQAQIDAVATANRPILLGKNGEMLPNVPLQQFEKERAQAGASVTLGSPVPVQLPDGTTGLYQPPNRPGAQGQLVKLDGKPAVSAKEGNMTEDQSKAAGWLVQATNSYNNMAKVLRDNPKAARPGVADVVASVPGLGGVGNAMRGADRQKFIQGASSLSEALLRAATGAGVNAEEARQKVNELTPVWGEDSATTQQKLESIPLYIESLKARAGKKGSEMAAGALSGSGVSMPELPTVSRIGKSPAKSPAVPDDVQALLKKYGGANGKP